MRTISFSLSARILTFLFIVLSLFHAFIIIGMLFFEMAPMDYLWGGRMETRDQLLTFEIVSLIIQLLVLWLVRIRVVLQRSGSRRIWIRALLWVMTLLFVLNTLGNLTAPSKMEKSAALLTLISAALTARLAREPWPGDQQQAA